MIIVDTEIAKRVQENRPIRLAMVGAGYSAKHIAAQIESSFPAIQLAVIVNRTPENAEAVFRNAGVENTQFVSTSAELEQAIESRTPCIADDARVAFDAATIDAVLETTGEVEYGAWVALESIKAGKHTFVLNCEMDATVGPLHARRNRLRSAPRRSSAGSPAPASRRSGCAR